MGYPFLSQISDGATQQALKAAWDTITDLKARIATLEARSTTNMGGAVVTNVGNPQADTDAVNLRTLRSTVANSGATFP